MTNIYNATKTITLNEQAGVTFENGKTSMTLELAAGETRTVEAKYVLTEADIVHGTFTNTVTANVGDKTFTATDTVPTTEIADANPYLQITKVVVSDDATKIYELGETVNYKITVKNAGNLTLTNVKVEDAKTGLKETISTLAPNETKEFTTSYQIQEKDVRAGHFDNVATGSADNPSDKKTKVDDGEATVPTETAKSSLFVEKTVTNAPEDGFAEGDEIIFSIRVVNNGNQTITGIAITDALVGNTGDNTLKVKDLKPGEEDTVTVKYTVTQNDLVKGSVKNEATAKGTDPSGNTVTAKDDATATTEVTNPSLTVKKDTISQPANGSTYALGETIRYRITVTNTGNLDLTNVKVIDTLANVEKVNPKDWTIDKLEVGKSVSVEATYEVTKADILNGEVVNAATAEATSPDGKEPKVEGDQTTDKTDAPNPHMTVVKTTTSSPKDGRAAYALGDTITYKITVTNDGNVDLTDVKVVDNKEGLVKDGAGLLTGDWATISLLAVGQTKEFTASYTVTEKDIVAGHVVNDATAEGTSPDGNEPTVVPGNTEDYTEDPNPHMTVVKTTTNRKQAYDLGETIHYEITVTNDGNLTLTGVNIVDTLPNVQKEDPDSWTNLTLGIGESKTVKASYVVTEADIRNGKVINDATATGTSPDGNEPTVVPGSTEDNTVPENKSITVHKDVTSTPANDSSYALGETITYEIVAENTGNQTLTNVVVTDPLTNGRWTITSMTPGQKSTVMTTSYVVTEADIRNGSVLNRATATSDENPKPTPGEKEVPTEQQKPSLFITKEADKTSNIQAGDVITYTITVTNNGNVTINDIEVKDQLTGDTFNKNVFNLIGSISLAPGESKQFTVRYTATQNDIVNGSIRNVATVTGTDPDGNPVNGEAEKTVDTERANADYTVTKTVDNPQAEYKVGDVINYTIRVTNTGNLTLNNLTVTDQMQGASGNAVIANRAGVTVNGNTATIATLAVGASIELKASYTVVRADADGTLANRVNVTSTTKPGEDPENPNGPTTPSKSDETDPTPTEKTYVLTIHYVDNNGNVVAPDYTARLLAGETIDAVVSPTIDGYTPNYGTVALPATGMPAANVTVTVVYTPDAPVVVPDNPENPNQPNNGGNNGDGNVVNNNNNNANNANNANNGNNAANNNAGQAAANPAPADGVIQPDDNGGYDLTPVEDTPTPLANMNLDDHACCILHFLIMLLTLIIFALYTKSRKNRQLKVEELREQLAIASIQKELDLSDEDMAKYLEEAKKLAEEKKQANA